MENANLHEESAFKFGILIKSFEAFLRIKAILVLLITTVLSGIIIFGASRIAAHFMERMSFGVARFFWIIGIILAALIYLIGYTATGKILMEYAKHKTSIPIGDAIIFALFSFYRFIISGIILLIIPLIVSIVALVYFLIAKIPGLGKLLVFLGLPAFSIIFAVLFLSILLISFMIAPIIFEGNNLKQLIVKIIKIYKKHFTLIFGYFIFIYIVLFIAALIFLSLSFGGLGLTSAILMITKPSYLYSNIYGGFGSGGFGGRGFHSPMLGMLGGLQYLEMFGGFIGFGISIIYMLVIALLSVYMILGKNFIYLEVVKDMDFGDVEAQFNDITSKVKSNVEKYKEKAASMSNANTTASVSGGNVANNEVSAHTSAAEVVKICSSCGAKNKQDANFCESCGAKLN